MTTIKTNYFSLLIGNALFLWSYAVLAQPPRGSFQAASPVLTAPLASAPSALSAPPVAAANPVGASVSYRVPPSHQPSAGASKTSEAEQTTDHSKVVGSFGVGWFGISDVPIGDGSSASLSSDGDVTSSGNSKSTVAAPVVGIRYWMNEQLGIDVGLGFSTSSGSDKVSAASSSQSQDKESKLAFFLHGGLPIALATGHHYIFQVVPELNVGYASGSTGGSNSNDVTGARFELGGRVGSEIQFGFMGLPALALEASVGLFLRRDSWNTSTKLNATTVDVSSSNFTISTSSINQPWDFFRGNVAARYYF